MSAEALHILEASRPLDREAEALLNTAYGLLEEARFTGTAKNGELVYPRSRLPSWRRFLSEFISIPLVPLIQYASKPETFSVSDFRLKRLLSTSAHGYSDSAYRRRGSYVTVDQAEGRTAYLDAPFGYALEYTPPSGRGEVISVISIMPDWEANRLRVDQFQAGSTSRETKTTKKGWRSRMKFNTPPENLLFDIAEDLARRSGLEGIDLRKPEAVKWFIRKEGTSYDKIATLRNLEPGSGEYFEGSFAAQPPEVVPAG